MVITKEREIKPDICCLVGSLFYDVLSVSRLCSVDDRVVSG
jgi:hypothetical protein